MIKCEICGNSLASVNWLHLRTHSISVSQYKEAFPNAPIHSQEVKLAISNGGKGNTRTLGHKLSAEHKRKIGKASKATWQKLGFREMMCQKRKGGNKAQKLAMGRPEVRAKISSSRKAHFKDPKNREKHRERQLCAMSTPEARHNNSIGQMGKTLSLEHRQSISRGARAMPNREEWVARLNKRMREWWEDEDNKARGVRAILRACNRRPNKAEASLAILLGEDWQYTGDGSLVIGGKCPDFWNGDHRLVELFGDFWHKGDNPQERIDLFAGYGYKCLVIWEHELADEDVTKQRIHDFSSCKI